MKHLFMNSNLLAIDIGTSSVKLLELAGKDSKRKVVAMGLEVLPRGAVVDGEIRNQKDVLAVIRRLLDQLQIETKNRRVAISVSGNAVILKRINFVPDPELDLGEQLFDEAKQHFHNTLEDMYFRYQLIESELNQDEGKTAVIVAAKIEIIEQYVQLVHELGMKVGLIDCDTFCLANMFEHNYPLKDTLAAIVNIGATSTQIFLTYNSEFLFSREFYIGGDHITEQIADKMVVDFENAESLKLSISSGEANLSDQIRPGIVEILDQISSEVNTTVSFFLESEEVPDSLQQLGYVYLCGGGGMTHFLAESISNSLKTPVQLINPFQQIDLGRFGDDMDMMLSQGALFGVAVGLALRKYNDHEQL